MDRVMGTSQRCRGCWPRENDLAARTVQRLQYTRRTSHRVPAGLDYRNRLSRPAATRPLRRILSRQLEDRGSRASRAVACLCARWMVDENRHTSLVTWLAWRFTGGSDGAQSNLRRADLRQLVRSTGKCARRLRTAAQF